MFQGFTVIDADSHKCENPPVFFDFIERPYRARISILRDRYGEQRFQIRDADPVTGKPEFDRTFLQIEGYGKGTYRPYHAETTLGGLFNRIRLEHMEREGIDHQVIYGSVPLAFNALIDRELAVALCRAYNDYIDADTRAHSDRLHPIAVLPIQDPTAAVEEMRRCVEELGMVGVTMAPHVPAPHPDAPEAFPKLRVPKALSHPDFAPILAEAERLDVAIGLHGAPGMQLAGGSSDQLDSFTLVHVFANRSMQQMALAKLIFDGTLEAFPKLRFGFLEAGVGWLPDLMHSLHEHWEKRILHFDPSVEPSIKDFVREFARERDCAGELGLWRKVRQVRNVLSRERDDRASRDEIEAFRNEHPRLPRDPTEYLARGQIFASLEPDDPAPLYLERALGPAARQIPCFAVDYGHWDATLENCVALVAERPGIDADLARRLLSQNALDLYGPRLAARIGEHPIPRPERRSRYVRTNPEDIQPLPRPQQL
ncbi:MAG: amidohydrolase family protein [Myxococcota bacterium]